MQCALDSTQYLCISTPPHQWPMKPKDGCRSSSEACQPNSPSRVGNPNIILGFLVVGNDAVLFLDFAAALANQEEEESERESTEICRWLYSQVISQRNQILPAR